MKNGAKIAIVMVLAVAVAATFALRGRKQAEDAELSAQAVPPAPLAAPRPAPPGAMVAPGQKAHVAAAIPRLLELGSNRCMACQQMAVVLDALRASQGAKLRVEFIDVMENPELGEPYQITLIPTQVLFDASGKELYRHIGFFSHDDILAKFRALGVKL
jgi:thioredoxin 1